MKIESTVKLQSPKARKICQNVNDFTPLKCSSYEREVRACSNTLFLTVTLCTVLFLLLILSVSISSHLVLAQGGAMTQNGQRPAASQGNATAGALIEKVSD